MHRANLQRMPAADLGPSIRRLRGDVVAERVAVGSIGDATRARVEWAPLRLHRLGRITDLALAACVRFRDAYELAEGARDGVGEVAPIRGASPPWSRLPVAEARMMARDEYRAATQACGIQASAVLAWCVLRDGQVRGWAECRGIDREQAAGYLLAAIDRLAEYYATLDTRPHRMAGTR